MYSKSQRTIGLHTVAYIPDVAAVLKWYTFIMQHIHSMR